MAAADVREVLDRLSRGEITAEQADAELGASDAAETTPLTEAEEPSTTADLEATQPLDGTPITVHASLNGSGELLVTGGCVDSPEIEGPASVSVADDSGTFTIRGGFADGSQLTVPADADLQLKVNGGAVTLSGLRGTLQGDFNVGDVNIAGRFDRGTSTINANAGPVVVTLAEGSDVRVMVRTGCETTVAPSISRTAAGEWLVGDGRATLTIRGNLGELILRTSDG